MNILEKKYIFSTISLVSSLLLLGAVFQLANQMIDVGIPPSFYSRRWVFLLFLTLIGIILFIDFILQFTRYHGYFLESLDKVLSRLNRIKGIGIVFGVVSLVLLVMVFIPTMEFHLFFPRLWFHWMAILGMVVFLKSLLPRHSIYFCGLASALVISVLYQLFSYIPDVNSYPFSLSWSESSRYYYASLWFSEKIWGQTLPLSPWHPSRYILQSFPFLISNSSLWFHRLWQSLLWIILPALSGIALARRFTPQSPARFWLLAGWVFLFLHQGPVYYHLHICLIIIFVIFDTRKSSLALLGVILASIWAGISRVNWFPVPAFIGVTIYLIEKPITAERNIFKYLKYPAIWVITGILSALFSQMIYMAFSGNEFSKFGSSYTSDLLWYRLLPNSTYGPGILLSILIVSVPLLLVFAFHVWNHRSTWHPVRLLGLGSMLLLLFIGGLVVSVKIGGGSNLHNMDAFMVILMVVGVYLFCGAFSPETDTYSSSPLTRDWVLALVVLVPVLLTFRSIRTVFTYNASKASNELAKLQNIVTNHQDGEILFISQRHLLVYNLLENGTLIRDYENIELMEMAIAGHKWYLDGFMTNIQGKKFDLIISNRLFVGHKNRNYPFSEENNAWAEWVAGPVLEHYQELLYLEQAGVQILAPKP